MDSYQAQVEVMNLEDPGGGIIFAAAGAEKICLAIMGISMGFDQPSWNMRPIYDQGYATSRGQPIMLWGRHRNLFAIIFGMSAFPVLYVMHPRCARARRIPMGDTLG